MKYEAHVTMEILPGDKEHLQERWESIARAFDWKTSRIDGDPVMGKKVFFYFTSYDTDPVKLLRRMDNLCHEISLNTYVRPVRKKIEQIVYDTKTSVNEIRALQPGAVQRESALLNACVLLLFLHDSEHVVPTDGSGAVVMAAVESAKSLMKEAASTP